MRLGLHALGIGTGADRGVIDAVASTADDCGFATLWRANTWSCWTDPLPAIPTPIAASSPFPPKRIGLTP